MRAEIISVGTELLLGQIVDTNAVYLSQLLPQFGIDLHYRITVGDNAARLTEALKTALSRADLVFTIGGLGPTEDDLTKETVAQLVGDEMFLDEELASKLQAFFEARGVEMPESNLKQAMVPRRGRSFPNPLGTAPGAAFETDDGKAIIVLPGPPKEFKALVDQCVVPYLRERVGNASNVIRSRVLRLTGIGESSVEDAIKHLISSTNPTVAPLASPGEVRLRITAKAPTPAEAEAMIDEMDSKIVSILGHCVFGRDDETLERVVVESLIARKLTLAVAESCTGGLVASRITDVPGCSAIFLAGVVSYSNEAKKELLGVPDDLLRAHGAVSEPVARAMAEGIRRVTGADIGVSTTGIAGPTGATETKPVGLVFTALAADSGTVVRRHQFAGDRTDIKLRASQAALDMVRMSLIAQQ
ncbi:MAG: competence/damage-inducible protein A [Armatimonadota bacterium]|nr:competence/damage-inducible protein A [Armatimonadota bacterium]